MHNKGGEVAEPGELAEVPRQPDSEASRWAFCVGVREGEGVGERDAFERSCDRSLPRLVDML